jgi:hypothetical protein
MHIGNVLLQCFVLMDEKYGEESPLDSRLPLASRICIRKGLARSNEILECRHAF